MESILPLRAFFSRLKKLFWLWLILAVVVGLVILLISYALQPDRNVAKAVVSYTYSGIESGYDPLGDRFDSSEIKNPEVVQKALAASELTEDTDVALIQDAITVTGQVPDGALDTVTDYQSIFQNDSTPSTTQVRNTSYFPTKFSVSFDYRSAGLSGAEGTRFFDALLESYRDYFYKTYGYTSIEDPVNALDYTGYDYDQAVEILDGKLSLLRHYLARLTREDTSRFVSGETGYSFSDLLNAVDTMRQEDLQRISSYIDTYNLTISKDFRIAYYTFKVEDMARKQIQQQERLSTLSGLIQGYEKTHAVVAGVLNSSGGTGEAGYSFEITQPSSTYDWLVKERISCQTDLSQTSERIDKFQTRLDRLLEEETGGGSAAVVTESLAKASAKIDALVDSADRTAQEYYDTVKLEGAYQVLSPRGGVLSGAVRTVRLALNDAVGAEVFLFGLYVLCAMLLAIGPVSFRQRADLLLARLSLRKKKAADGSCGQ